MENKEKLKQLREQTGISMIECKKALEESEGDLEKAKNILRERGKEMLKSKEGRELSSGIISSYIHPGDKIGVLVQLLCETDFVAKSDDLKKLARELCLQIAASKPLFVSSEEISKEFLDGERKIYEKQFADLGKPKEIIDKIIEGKINKYKEGVSLLSQEWVKEPSKTIKALVEEHRVKIGERIEIGKFSRFEI